MSQPPADWYPDGSGQLRYWDGFQWTEHTAPTPADTATAVQSPYTTTNYHSYATYPATFPQTNGMGAAGFVLSIVAVFMSWAPVIGSVLWILGAVLSLIGVFKQPRGLAIAGLVISFFGLILVILFLTALAGIFAFV